jgi:probable rRNA maturation factor
MTPSIDIAVESPLWAEVVGIERLIQRAILATLASTDARLHPEAELSVLLCDDARIQTLNKNWRDIDKATNVLAFPAGAASQLARAKIVGDLAISFETVDREAQSDHKSFADHFSHLVVHGWLHILGYDHANRVEAEAMEAVERRVLHTMNIADPYRNTLETPVP